MKTQSLNVVFQGQPFVGFSFLKLPLGAALQVASEQVDETADQARLAVIGDPLRALEYQIAGQEAEAFAQSGYAGEAPPTVQAWMEAAGLDAKDATDSILTEATAWKGALYTIRATRLKAKQAIREAATAEAAEAIADVAIEAIKACVKGIGNAA